MEFTIKEAVKREGIPNTFFVELYWEHGDAGGESTTISNPFQRGRDEWALEEFVLALIELNSLNSRAEVEEHEEYIKWFDIDDDEYGEVEEKYKPFARLDAEYDMCYGDGIAGFSGFRVYYNDQNMNKCEVSYN